MADNLLIKDANNANASLRTTDLGNDLHVPHHARFYPDKPDTTGNLAAVAQAVPINVTNITGLVIAVSAAAVSGASAVFEASPNSTNGTDGTWYQVQAQRSNANDTFDTGFTTITATPIYYWNLPVAGVNWFRVRMTALTSGSVDVRLSPCDDLVFPSRTGSVTVFGQIAHDSAVSGNPVRIGSKAVSTMPAAVSATNDVADGISTLQGVHVVTNDSVTAQKLRATLALTTTTDTAIFAAQGTGLRGILTDMQIMNTGAAVDLIIKDGSTVIWQMTLPQNVPIALNGLRSPLLSTANTALNAALSAAGTVRLNAQGYQGV